MNNKIYIAGRITGDTNYKAKFLKAEEEVSDFCFFDLHGVKAAIRIGSCEFEPVNPTHFTFFGSLLEKYSWTVSMAVCIHNLLWCSYVYMLDDWKESRGARVEHRIAKLTGKILIYQKRQTK